MLTVPVVSLFFLYTVPTASSEAPAQVDIRAVQSKLSATPTPTTSSEPASSTSVLRIRCDGDYYGRNLNVASCREVFSFMPKSDVQTVFAERRTGVPYDVPLPWRTMSSQ